MMFLITQRKSGNPNVSLLVFLKMPSSGSDVFWLQFKVWTQVSIQRKEGVLFFSSQYFSSLHPWQNDSWDNSFSDFFNYQTWKLCRIGRICRWRRQCVLSALTLASLWWLSPMAFIVPRLGCHCHLDVCTTQWVKKQPDHWWSWRNTLPKGWLKADLFRSLSWVLFNSSMPKTWQRWWDVFIKLAVLIHLRGGHCSGGFLWTGGMRQQVPHGRQGTSARM